MLDAHRRRLPLCALLFVLAIAPVAAEEISKIVPKGYVTDLAGVIPSAVRQRLEALSAELEQKTGAQLAIVTVTSLDDRPIEDYAVDLFKHLGVGAKKQDTGVLLLVAPNQRKYRIEVGYGLEPVITDARAGDAGRAMVPLLRRNDFGSAVETAAGLLAGYVADDKGVTLSAAPPVTRPNRRPADSSRGFSPLRLLWLLAILFIFLRIARANSRYAGRGLGGCWWILPFLSSGGGSGWGGGYRSGGSAGGSNWGGGGWGGGGGFGGFGGGSSGGGGASGSW